jgi:hypothetical protein
MIAGRGIAARLSLFAVLFQAFLFGWHHHDLTFPGRLPMPVVEDHSAAPQIADDEDGCEICQVLHHLTAAPVDTPAVPPPLGIAAPAEAGNAFTAHAPALGFYARAPPRSMLHTG